MKKYTLLILALTFVFIIAGCGSKNSNNSNSLASNTEESNNEESSSNGDINLDKLNDAVDSINNLDLGPGKSDSNSTTEAASDNNSTDTAGNVTKYSYTDVVKSGNDLTVTPNDGMNSSTILYSDKDLNGFLDYIDSKVLEEGRTINRSFFYEILAITLVDSELSPNFYKNEKDIMMALAVANNFHNMDVKIKDCYLDANNASEYHYNVVAEGKDDTWIVDYGKKSFYMNNGKTEYHSTMFEDQYLAVWLTAIEDYYGISSKS